MALPDGYFYRQGYYWKVDGTGPYLWTGSTMRLIQSGVEATAVPAGSASEGFFNRDTTGPATESGGV